MTIIDVPQSGRHGDFVYYMRGNKLCRRLYAIPTNRWTAAQVRARGAFGAISTAWKELLAEEQRLAWNAAGPKVLSHPRLEQSGPLTGQQHFEGINSARARIGREMLLWPPERVVFGPNPVEGLSMSDDQGRMRLKVRVVGPVVEDIMVFGAALCSTGRKKWRNGAYLGLLPVPQRGMSDITELYVARYGELKVGERVFIRTRQQVNGQEGDDKDISDVVRAEPVAAARPKGCSAAKPQPKKIEDGGLRMEGLASGYASARAQEILLKTRDSWVLHCRGVVGWQGKGRDEGCTREQYRGSPRPPLGQCRGAGGGCKTRSQGWAGVRGLGAAGSPLERTLA
jgi:hypothetical protein